MSTPTKYEGHTPGKWTVGLKGEFETLNPNIVYAENGDSICSLYDVPLHTSLEELERSGNFHDSIGLANARLIAAAPALLAENARLREALRKIAYEPFGPADASFQAVLDSVIGCAQQALAEGKGEKG